MFELADAGPPVGQGAAVGRGQRRAVRRLPEVQAGPLRPNLADARAGRAPRARCSATVERRLPASAGPGPHRAADAGRAHRGRPAGVVVRAVHRARAADAAGRASLQRPPTPVPSAASTPSSACWRSTARAGWPTTCSSAGDRMAMAASVELRPPFLDHQLVELAFSLPSRVKVHRRPDEVGAQAGGPPAPAREHRRPPQGRLPGAARRLVPRPPPGHGPRHAARAELVRRHAPSTRSRCGRCSTPTSRAGATSRSGSGRCCRSRSGTTSTSAAATARPARRRSVAGVATDGPLVTSSSSPTTAREHIGACLDSVLAELPDDGSEVVVLDNASTDGTADLVEQRWPAGRTSSGRPENLGFARACNRRPRSSSSRYVLLLNPDAVMLPGCLAALLDLARRRARRRALRRSDLHRRRRRRPDVVLGAPDAVEHVLLRHRPVDRVRLERRASTPRASGRGPATSSARSTSSRGACCWPTGTAWERLGGFDERFFMYGEDFDLGIRAAAAGLPADDHPGRRHHPRRRRVVRRGATWRSCSTGAR